MDKTDDKPLYVEHCNRCGTGIPASADNAAVLAGGARVLQFTLAVHAAPKASLRAAFYDTPLMRQSYRLLLCGLCADAASREFSETGFAYSVGE